MKVFVPDASVILKWVLSRDEDNKDKAYELLQGWLNEEYEFILPSLWVYEVGNVLGLKVPKEAGDILKNLLEYNFNEYQMTEKFLDRVFNLIKQYKGITFYDAAYHAIALEKNGILITADKAYFKKVKGTSEVMLI